VTTPIAALELHIDSIVINERHRKDLGDIKELAASIDDLGLIHPVVVTPDHHLVAGERRLAALRSLGWDTVPVTVIHTLNGAADLLQAEADENTCRKDFAPTEAAAVRRAVTEALAPIAEQRRESTQGRPKTGGNLPPVSTRQPKTRDVAAKGTGYSGRTLDKVDEVVHLVESPETPEPVREVAREAVASMNSTGRVDGAHKLVKDAQAREAAPKPSHVVTELIESDQTIQDARYIHEYTKRIARAGDFLIYDPARIGQLCSTDDLISLEHLIDSTQKFLAAVRKSRSGLKLVKP
jgi:ParB family chromosome partitioning protein